MYKKISILVFSILFFSCSSNKNIPIKRPLYEVLLTKDDGGANIKFYEIISEPNEINMLLGDPDLRKLVKKDDIKTCNYMILNLGPLPMGTYNSVFEKAEETATNIVIKVKEIRTKPANEENQNTVYPYSIIRINSKKAIILK
jgi:hypothetical protein